MRIERRDGDAAARNAKRLERLVGKRDDTAYPFRRHALRHVFERGVGGDVAHAHIAVDQQHHAIARPSEIGEQLRVTAIVMAGEVQRFLADWPGANGVSDAVEREAYGGRDRVIRYASAFRRRLAGRDGNTGCVDVDETDRGQIGARLRDRKPASQGRSNPSCFSASWCVERAPMRRSENSPSATRSRTPAAARAMISGPIPAGSPEVTAILGPVTFPPSFSRAP